MRRRHPSAALATVSAVAVAGLVVTASGAAAAPTALPDSAGRVVISEVYGGGGNSGATLKNDFVELYNPGTSAVSVAGWGVQYTSSSGTASWTVTDLTGSVPAGGHYLVEEAAGTGGTQDLPDPDDTGSIAMSATAGTVALTSSTTALSCHSSADCTAASNVVDLVGFGTAAIHEGSAAAPAPSNTTSDARAADGTDTDDNGADFQTGPPTPMNSGNPTGPQPGSDAIHDIQGDSFVSPLNGQSVTNVAGIVTALRTSSSKGFWMQDPDPDNDPATSEGIFVYTSSAPTVSVGDSVLVSGKVSDYYALNSGETLSTTSSLSVTEIDGPTVSVVSSGNTLPAPVVLTANSVPDTYAPDLDGGNIEKTPIQPNRSALDFYESLEGMRVEVDDARVVGPSNQYGEQYVTTKPDQARTYRGGTELLADNATPSGRLEIATLDGSNPGLDVGDVLQGATVGPLDWSLYGGYVLEATSLGTVVRSHPAPVVATPPAAKQLSVATYNVENLSPTDPDSKFNALAQGVVHNLATPDVIALEEIQDNDGATDDGVVAADKTLNKLTAAIEAAGGPSYNWREISPVNDQDGGEPGGNIRSAFLYNPDRVTFVDRGSTTTDRSVTGTRATKVNNKIALTLSPGRIDPTNPVWNASRKPLVGQFLFRGKTVIVVANHFVAKLGDQNADGRFQYPAQNSRIQRAGQAEVEHNFVQSVLTTAPHTDVVVVGDLNDYQFSPPLAALETGTADASGPAILADLITTLPTDQQYTYVYDGISEVLDHILVSPQLDGTGAAAPEYQVVHVNAEYTDQVSDHDPQVVDLTP